MDVHPIDLDVFEDEVRATAALDELEGRLTHSPRVCLGVSETASVAAICEAFAELARTFHPKRFATRSDEARHRANRNYRKLRDVFWGLTETAETTWLPVAGAPDDDLITLRLWRGVGSVGHPAPRKKNG